MAVGNFNARYTTAMAKCGGRCPIEAGLLGPLRSSWSAASPFEGQDGFAVTPQPPAASPIGGALTSNPFQRGQRSLLVTVDSNSSYT